MSRFNQYWTLIKLTGSGKGHPKELSQAKTLIQQLAPRAEASDEVPNDRQLQRQLFEQANGDFDSPAMLALRCYISHQAIAVCYDLVKKFGEKYALQVEELLPLVLDDEGKPIRGAYKPKSHKILTTFDPERANLSTWSSRLINSSNEFNHYLEQQGLRRITDWAILNNTKPSKIKRLQKDAATLDRTLALLQAYQTVYTQGRLLQGKKGQKCEDPTPAQLQEISELMLQQGFTTAAEAILPGLTTLARLLREENGPPSISLDVPERRDQYEALVSPPDEPELEDSFSPEKFVAQSEAELSACLPRIVKEVILQHHKKHKPKKAAIYPRAMTLFYCEGIRMKEMAPHLDINDQSGVTRLLKLKQLRTDIRHAAIAHLKPQLSTIVTPSLPPDALANLDQSLDNYLGNQLDGLIQDEANEAQTPRQHLKAKRSRLATIISQVLRELYPAP